MKSKIVLTGFLLLFSFCLFGQINQYNYKRELYGIKDSWHKLVLPDDMYSKISPDFSDIRIFGITDKNDTIEAPYILKVDADEISQKEVAFKLINQSKNKIGFYFTFEIPEEKPINQINLDFKQQNFDWRVTLEGSQNLHEWFLIQEKYRILSIKNDITDFAFSKVTFSDSKYKYFRLLIASETKPELLTANLSLYNKINGNFKNCIITSTSINNEKKNKQTIVNVDLKEYMPVCRLKVYVKNAFDYYRPVTIQYLADSFKTQKEWKYTYSTLATGTLTSIEKNEFNFSSTIAKKLKIIIENNDNEPLEIDSFTVQSNVHWLIARFTTPATYFLTYGSKQAIKPHYDINMFADKIPANLSELKLGNELFISKAANNNVAPLFVNKNWLWIIIVFTVLVLGWFSLKMIKQK